MFAVSVRSPALIEHAPVGVYRKLDLDLRLMAAGGAVSTATLEIPASHPAVAALVATGTGAGDVSAGIVVRRAGTSTVVFSGSVVDLDLSRSTGGTLSVICEGDDAILSGEIAYPATSTDVSSSATSPFGSAQDARTGAAETVILGFIAANIGPAAGVVRRRYPWLVVPAAHGTPLGTSGTWSGRLDDLLTLCRNIAITSGIAWRLVQAAQGQIGVEVWAPAAAPAARFSRESGSVSELHYRWNAPRTDETIIGGAGSGASRVFTRRDAAGVTAGLRRRARLVDQSSSSVLAELRQSGDQQLADDAPTAGITITAADRPGRQFGVDYHLGDVATASDTGGVGVTDVIQRVEITHEADSGGGMLAPVVRPTIGAINAQDTSDQVRRVRRLIDATVRS